MNPRSALEAASRTRNLFRLFWPADPASLLEQPATVSLSPGLAEQQHLPVSLPGFRTPREFLSLNALNPARESLPQTPSMMPR